MNEWTRYILIKFSAYALWSAAGLALLRREPPRGARLFFTSLGLGGLRLALGMGFGFVVFLCAGLLPIHGTFRDYVAIYAPVRVVEWGILAAVIQSGGRGRGWKTPRLWIWIALGILVSFAADIGSPIPIKERFCIGRCLC